MFGDKLKKMFNMSKKNEKEELEEISQQGKVKNNIEEEKKKIVIGNDKKKIENLVFFVVLLIITILIINFIWNGNDETNKEITNDASKKLASSGSSNFNSLESGEINGNGSVDSDIDNVENLENKLKNILSKIKGVEDVNVCLNYSESSEVVAMYNENSKTTSTEETDDTGGTRKIEETDSQKEVIYKEDDGVKTPITAKIIKPKIEGAIITAKGVENAEIKTNVIQAVEAVTGLATHKIQVLVSK